MAKISVEFDTTSKVMSCSIDGKAVKDVTGISVYQSYDDTDLFRCSIVTMTKDEDADIDIYTNLVASESAAGDAAVKNGSPMSTEHPSFVQVNGGEMTVCREIGDYFSK